MPQRIPHPIPYQGSKRNLASRIMRFANTPYDTLYEPFAGSAAISLYAAYNGLAKRFVIGDSFTELVELWRMIINRPDEVIRQYSSIWCGQKEGDTEYFFSMRERFNVDRDPVILLYLIARCVKNAVRFNKEGNFSQSADKRRKGTHPDKMQQSILGASSLLRGKTSLFNGDFSACIKGCGGRDLIYMDPPYQGTTYGRDKRYFHQLNKELLYSELRELNKNKVHFILSYDGFTGETQYGEALPEDIEAQRYFLDAGRSSQATLSGKKHVTYESLYISRHLVTALQTHKEPMADDYQQQSLFA